MLDQKPTHIRKGATITTVATGEVETYKYINQAKRASRRLQLDKSVILRRNT